MKVSKSIFDVRFSSKKMALDAAVKKALIALDAADDDDGYWITMHGAHIHVNNEGKIDKGADGKFDGRSPDDVRKTKAQEYNDAHKSISSEHIVDPYANKDRHGNELPPAQIPETLDGASDYFKKMAIGWGDQLNFWKGWGRKDQINQIETNMKNYQKLREAMDKWDDAHRPGFHHIAHQMADMPKDVREKIADDSVKGLFKYASCDPRGVGKWAAANAYEEMKDELPREKRMNYAAQLTKWKV